MIVEVYKNSETNMILIHSKSHPLDEEKYKGYEFIEAFEGNSWKDCNQQITQKYFSYKEFVT